MSNDFAISVQNLSKTYRTTPAPATRLFALGQEALADLLPKQSAAARYLRQRETPRGQDFHALRALTFNVKRGEAVGIVGRNGSGKSTLLQIIAGTMQPTAGFVQVQGRVAALLELGSGFNPEFTGRENVYLNGAIQGLSREAITAIFPEIAAFADIGNFLEQPVKTYSSGMMMRLAFAVQTAIEPDVLIVDEALSVGDAPFQAKCFARLRAIQDKGCTILFVSHDIGAVKTFCQQAIWLDEGVARAQGSAQEVCAAYDRDCLRAMGMNFPEAAARLTAPAHPRPHRTAPSHFLHEDRAIFQKFAAAERRGNGRVQLLNFFFVTGEKGQRSSLINWAESVTAVFVLGSTSGYHGLFQCGLVGKTIQGQELLCCSDRQHKLRLALAPNEEVVVTMQTQLPLRAGQYLFTAGIFLFPDDAQFPHGTYDFTRATVADFINCCAVIDILPQFSLGIHGPVQIESQMAMPAL